jgi:hypothetical protein
MFTHADFNRHGIHRTRIFARLYGGGRAELIRFACGDYAWHKRGEYIRWPEQAHILSQMWIGSSMLPHSDLRDRRTWHFDDPTVLDPKPVIQKRRRRNFGATPVQETLL